MFTEHKTLSDPGQNKTTTQEINVNDSVGKLRSVGTCSISIRS